MNQFREKMKNKFGGNIITATYSIILFLILLNIKTLYSEIAGVLSHISPFLVGIVIAFILNLPMRFIENHILNKTKLPQRKKRALSIVFTFIFATFVIVAILRFVIPQLTESIATLSSSIQGYVTTFESLTRTFFDDYDISPEILSVLNNYFDQFVAWLTSLLTSFVPYSVNLLISLANGAFDFIISVVLSIYMLSSKERIISSIKKVLYSIFKIEVADEIIRISRITNHTFGRFIGGQLTEAFILASLIIIGMSILGLEYAFLIGTIMGVTSIVPIVGGFVGAIPGVIILFLISPIKALIFIIFILILQQFEGNVIYPRVVGNSIGISGMWILFALLLGGGLYGIPGILLGIPGFAVFYNLVKEWTSKKIAEKNIPKEKLDT